MLTIYTYPKEFWASNDSGCQATRSLSKWAAHDLPLCCYLSYNNHHGYGITLVSRSRSIFDDRCRFVIRHNTCDWMQDEYRIEWVLRCFEVFLAAILVLVFEAMLLTVEWKISEGWNGFKIRKSINVYVFFWIATL